MRMNRSVLGAAILAMAAGAAVSVSAKEPSRDGGTTGQVNGGMREPTASRPVMLVPTEWAFGTKVIGSDGDKIGDINDLVIARRTGRVMYALVGQGGVLGVGERTVAVPFTALRWRSEDRAFSLPMTKEQVKAAPALESGDWKMLADSSKTDAAWKFFGVEPRKIDQTDSDDGKPVKSQLAATDWPVLRASDIRGKKLMGDDGRELGKVDELVFDTASGRIAFAVVTFGGTLGFGTEHVPIPWPLLDVNKDGGVFAPNLDKEKVQATPRLTESEWAELKDPHYGNRVYTNYGINAPWLDRVSDSSDPYATKAYNTAYATGTDRRVTGKITSIDQMAPAKGVADMTCLVVRADNDEKLTVHIAPKWYLDDNRVNYRTGDEVTVTGRWVDLDGKHFLVASEVRKLDGTPLLLRQKDGETTWTRR